MITFSEAKQVMLTLAEDTVQDIDNMGVIHYTAIDGSQYSMTRLGGWDTLYFVPGKGLVRWEMEGHLDVAARKLHEATI